MNSIRPDIVDLIGPEFDQETQGCATKILLICSAPRTGSYELCRFLIAAGIGVPHEYFNPNYAHRLASRWGLSQDVLSASSIEGYIGLLRRRRVAGDVFAAKIQYNQFAAYLQNSVGAALFDKALVVHLLRADIAAQVASFRAAMKSGRWDYSETQTTVPRLADTDNMGQAMRSGDIDAILNEDAGFRRLFAQRKIRPYFLTTEDLFSRPVALIESIAEALDVAIDRKALENAVHASAPYPKDALHSSGTISISSQNNVHAPKKIQRTSRPETIRAFWHGDQLGSYHLLGMRSFFDFGHSIELFTYDPSISVPRWITRRDANEVWPTDHVLAYQHGLGKGSFALHSNLFRFAMLYKLGGWAIDLDMVLLQPNLPESDFYFSIENAEPMRATFSVLKFPAGHPALAEGMERCAALGETAPLYGETGPDLFTELVAKHGLQKFGQPMALTYPLSALDVPALFNPEQSDELKRRCSGAHFVHLFNETWRRAGIPLFLGPPEGSFIDDLLHKHGLAVPLPRIDFEDLKRWTAYLTLHDEYQAGLKAYKLSNEDLQRRLVELEKARAISGAALEATGLPDKQETVAKDALEKLVLNRIGGLEGQIEQLSQQVNSLAGAYSRARHQWRRLRLRPPLWTFEQHNPREIRIRSNYSAEELPSDPISIAVATPSFNSGPYLRATIESVLGQNYPHLRYFVQDGGSTDSTVELLQSYGSRVMWRSEKDDGQAQAINRALSAADSDIMAYLNSDDLYLPGTLAYVAKVFQRQPEVDFLYGHRIFIDRDGLEIGRAVLPAHDAKALDWADYVPQETMFWRRRVWDAIGPFDESFDYALDWDFLLRAQHAGFKFLRLPRFLACFRVHDQQKTSKIYDRGREEMQRLRKRYIGHEPTHREILRNISPYLVRQFIVHWLYRFRILNY